VEQFKVRGRRLFFALGSLLFCSGLSCLCSFLVSFRFVRGSFGGCLWAWDRAAQSKGLLRGIREGERVDAAWVLALALALVLVLAWVLISTGNVDGQKPQPSALTW
jgi:hypothetical protein